MNEAGAESWSAREPARAQRGAARRGVVAGEDAGAAAHARLIGFGFDARPIFRCHLRMDLLAGVLRVGSP